MTPRRVMTLQCSQMGLTLERTFNGPSPRKILIEPRSIDGPVSPRKGPDYDPISDLWRAAQLRQRPTPRLETERQEQCLPAQLRCPGDDVATRQLDEPLPQLDLAHHGDIEPPLLHRPHIAAQQLDRLRAPQGRRRVGTRDLQHDARALPDKRLRVMGQPRVFGPLRCLGQGALGGRSWRDGDARNREKAERRIHAHTHTPEAMASASRRYAATESGAAVIGRPTTRCVAPRRTASSGPIVRDWSPA